jgi:uncharacterized NAD-dependent epimerase/dehydratase family protein
MLTYAPFRIKSRRTLLLADGLFSPAEAKTAVCFLMYRAADAVAVLDPRQAGKTAGEVVGFGGDVPVVGSVGEALALRPEIAIVGTAPRGGVLETDLRASILACLRARVDVVSGLHDFLADDEECRRTAAESGAGIWDVRRVSPDQKVSTGAGCTTGARTLLLVGTDCNVGKMTVTVELHSAAVARGVKAAWAATGQTGIILRERGIAVDRVVADFIGGAAEELVNEEGAGKDLVFVEGQGAIIHPGYAGVTLGLMYGVMPDCMILVHSVDREALKRLETPVRPLPELIDLHQHLLAPFKVSPVVGVALNTSSVGEAGARAALRRVQDETGLPAADVVRFGCTPILEAVLAYLKLG